MTAKLIQRTATFLIGMAVIMMYTSCVDSNKDYYDPNHREPNPMGNDVVAPDGFDWATSATVKVNVVAGDEFEGQYFYQIEILDANPLERDNYNVLAKGVAKRGIDFNTEVAVPHSSQYIYIRQIDPRGRDRIRQYDITESKEINCSFLRVTVQAAKMLKAETRAAGDIDIPVPPSYEEQTYDISGATSITSSIELKSGGRYIISGDFTGDLTPIICRQEQLYILQVNGALITVLQTLILS